MSLKKSLSVLMFLGVALVLPGCVNDSRAPKHLKPLSSKTLALMDDRGMSKRDPITIRIFKEESLLEVWKRNKSGRYALMKSYPICAWSGVLGPKRKEGDRQAPEGFYTITPGLMNPNSSYYLSFNMGYPNAYDRAHNATGKHLMVHGACSSAGCYSMNDEPMGEIYALAREAFKGGQRSFQVQAYPFRMTPENLARHRNNPNMPFWKTLKEGSDHFEVTGLPPEIGVCGRNYVFNAQAPEGQSLVATSSCPALTVPEAVRVAVAEKQERDSQATEIAIAALMAKPASGQDQIMSTIMVASADTRDGAGRRPVTVPGAPPLPAADDAPASAASSPEAVAETAVASVRDDRNKSGFFSRVVNAADPRGWLGRKPEAVPQTVMPASVEVPLPTARPQRAAALASTYARGYAPVRGINAGDGDLFSVFDLFARVGKAWAPKDSLAVQQRGR